MVFSKLVGSSHIYSVLGFLVFLPDCYVPCWGRGVLVLCLHLFALQHAILFKIGRELVNKIKDLAFYCHPKECSSQRLEINFVLVYRLQRSVQSISFADFIDVIRAIIYRRMSMGSIIICSIRFYDYRFLLFDLFQAFQFFVTVGFFLHPINNRYYKYDCQY